MNILWLNNLFLIRINPNVGSYSVTTFNSVQWFELIATF